MKTGHFEYIIKHRIEDYKHDIDCVMMHSEKYGEEDKQRIREDEIIMQELEKILTGKNLHLLSSL